jgi:hypothetical protein
VLPLLLGRNQAPLHASLAALNAAAAAGTALVVLGAATSHTAIAQQPRDSNAPAWRSMMS